MCPQSTALFEILQDHLPWHKARVKFVACFLIALIRVRSVNFTQLALALNPAVLPDSNYRRLQRFFKGFDLDQETITRLQVALLPEHLLLERRLVLSLDRTLWCIGSHYHNVLVVAACVDGVALPLAWSVLDKIGSSNTRERIALLDQLFRVLDPALVDCLVADREFIGQRWLRYLEEKPLRFVIRIKRRMWISTRAGRQVKVERLFRDLRAEEVRGLRKRRQVCGRRLWVTGIGHRVLAAADMVLLISNVSTHVAQGYYQQRWKIEPMFAAMKTRGFDLEATHLKDGERVLKLVGLLAIGCTWAYRVGEFVAETIRPIKIKAHGRRARSIFRHGLDYLREIVLNRRELCPGFRDCLQVLSCT